MSDFTFLQNPLTKIWIISAPRRAFRPDIAKGSEPTCPFCPGKEGEEVELYRVTSRENTTDWLIRVLPNKFPFTPIHEVIVHSPDHHKNFDELPLSQSELILQTYRNRYLMHQNSGQVYIFHNHGEAGGESLPHPHTQLAVTPFDIKMNIPRLDPSASESVSPTMTVQTSHFYLFCPRTSQWPDEVWIAPKKRGRNFGEITDEEITSLAEALQELIRILDLRHGHEFPFNFYIYPGGDWYLRLIPRQKNIGGFELGTGVYVNTQDPKETITFLKTHFGKEGVVEIAAEHTASYSRHV